jgi:hypothetical protein
MIIFLPRTTQYSVFSENRNPRHVLELWYFLVIKPFKPKLDFKNQNPNLSFGLEDPTGIWQVPIDICLGLKNIRSRIWQNYRLLQKTYD